VDATYTPEERSIALELRGVEVLELDLPRLEPRPEGPIELRVGGRTLTARNDAKVYLTRSTDGFAVSDAPPPLEGRKRHGQSGPLDDLQHAPFTIVVGTQDERLTSAYRLVAEHLRTLGGTADLAYPVLDDVAADDQALEGRSVVLLGTPEQNLLTRAIADTLPAKLEPGAVIVAGQRHEGEHVATSFIAPRPEGFAAARVGRRADHGYVVVHGASSARSALAIRSLPRFLPDYVVYDERIAIQKGGLLFDRRPVRAAGFFSEHWR
jgi:hypothetical protein